MGSQQRCFKPSFAQQHLRRPLVTNIGDFLGLDKSEGGLGLGALGTSILFLGTIFAVVVYLTVTEKDGPELAYQAEE